MTGIDESQSLFLLTRCEGKFLIEGEENKTTGNQEMLDFDNFESFKSSDSRMEYH